MIPDLGADYGSVNVTGGNLGRQAQRLEEASSAISRARDADAGDAASNGDIQGLIGDLLACLTEVLSGTSALAGSAATIVSTLSGVDGQLTTDGVADDRR